MMSAKTLSKTEFEIAEASSNSEQVTQKGAVVLEKNSLGLCINFDGYGVYGCNPGTGGPIFLERYEGRLCLLVWADINSEEPTHIIDLEGANECNREDDDEEQQRRDEKRGLFPDREDVAN